MVRSLIFLLVMTAAATAEPTTRPSLTVGTLQSSPDRAAQMKAAGVTLVTVSVAWDQFLPEPDHIDYHYVNGIISDIRAFRKAGLKVQIDLGLQYPPDWALKLPHARYVNQFGDAYIDKRPGANVVNGVFNDAIRKAQAAYVEAVFREIDAEFFAVRLGWNYYGELGYPAAKFAERGNCYWAFDDLAQGRAQGLPATLKPCPVAGWSPGTPSASHASARQFAEWYLDSLVDYQAFQITTVRRHFKGRLIVLIGSWGIRPETLARSVEQDLGDAGQTEISLGYDLARLVNRIDDSLVVTCTTWIDASPTFADDPPVRRLSELVRAHPRQLELWGENTGKADRQAMKLSFDRARTYGVSTLVWAFEPELFDGKHASLADLRPLMDERPPGGHNSQP